LNTLLPQSSCRLVLTFKIQREPFVPAKIVVKRRL
jgi:hypothetical protein